MDYSLQLLLFLCLFFPSQLQLGFTWPTQVALPLAENVSIFMGHFAPVHFQTLITTKPTEIK